MPKKPVHAKAGHKKHEAKTDQTGKPEAGKHELKAASSSTQGHREDPRLEAAQRRIRESASQEDALEAIREIVTNLLGCEEIGLFKVEQDSGGLFWSFGIDPQHHGTLEKFEKSVLLRVLQGEFHVMQVDQVGQTHHGFPPLRVFVPIRLDGRTVAVLVMLKLLPQKIGFDEADIRLVQVLSEESGSALFGRSTSAGA